MDLSSELIIVSSDAYYIIDINYFLSGEFYYSSLISSYVISYNPEDQSETNQFRLPSGSVKKFTLNPYSGDLYIVEDGSDTIKVIHDYMNYHANSPGSVLPSSDVLSHPSTIRDLATDPTDPYGVYFSTFSGSIYRAYQDFSGSWQVGLFMDVPLADVGGSWNGEFSFDNFGNLYTCQGTGGNVYRYDATSGGFSLIHSSPSTAISSICFNSANILHYTTGDNRVYRLVSLTQSITDYSINEPLEIAIIFVGYDQELINVAEIDSRFPHYGQLILGDVEDTYYRYRANYAYHFADQSYKDALDEFVADNSRVDPTAQLNRTALEYQATEWDPQDIFLPKNGTAIDGNAVESWLAQNRYTPGADYCIYLLNFSYFDTEGQDHWFEIKDVDADTGIERHWYRNEFDFPWNLDAEFPYVGYTGYETPDIFIDPYSYQWYLEWREAWNGLYIDDGDHEFYDEDLDHFMETHDPTISTGRTAINDYIADWLAELVPVNLFWEPLNRIDFTNDLSVQVMVFNGVTDLGFQNSDLTWTINMTGFEFALSELLPSSNIDLNVTFLDLEDYSSVQSILSSNIVDYSSYGGPPIDNYTYYNGYGIFNSLFGPQYIRQFFDFDVADLVVTGYAFILDNATFASPGIWAGGGLFTGLGGGGRILQLMELDRLYYPNRTDSTAIPRQGFSKVFVHETGHAIGFPHMFTSTQYAPDFTGDTMGYYGGFSRYSRIRIEGFQRYAAEQEIFIASKKVQEHVMNNTETAWLVYLQGAWNDITGNYTIKNYVEARKAALDFQQLMDEGPFDVPPIITTTTTTVTSGSNTTGMTGTTTTSLQGIGGYEFLFPLMVLVIAVAYKRKHWK
jgi:hypothetical protein